MQKISFRKTGIYFSIWDELSEKWIEKELGLSNLPFSWYLQYAVEVEETISVKDILKLLKPYQEHIEFIFASALAGISLNELYVIMEQANLEKAKILPSSLCLLKIGESTKIKSDFDDDFNTEENFLTSYSVLIGVEEIGDSGEDDAFHSLTSIDFKNWCDLSLEVDDFIEYVDIKTEDTLFDGVFNWQLFDFISSILSQIAITVQVNESVSKKSEEFSINSGPIHIDHIFEWIDDLDKIFLGK